MTVRNSTGMESASNVRWARSRASRRPRTSEGRAHLFGDKCYQRETYQLRAIDVEQLCGGPVRLLDEAVEIGYEVCLGDPFKQFPVAPLGV